MELVININLSAPLSDIYNVVVREVCEVDILKSGSTCKTFRLGWEGGECHLQAPRTTVI